MESEIVTKGERRRLNTSLKNRNKRQSEEKDKAAQIQDPLKLDSKDDTISLLLENIVRHDLEP